MITTDPVKLRLGTSPPSTNRAWRKFRGNMVKSPEARSWEENAIKEIKAQAGRATLPSPGYFQVQIFFARHDTIDLDNKLKLTMDALHRAGITPDDRYLVKLRTEFWGGDQIIIYVKHERLEQWQSIMKTSKPMAKRMHLALTSKLPL